MNANEEVTKRFFSLPVRQCMDICKELELVKPGDEKLDWMDYCRKAFSTISRRSLHAKFWQAINEKSMDHQDNPYDRAELVGLLSCDPNRGVMTRAEAEANFIDPDKEREAEEIAEQNMFAKSPLDAVYKGQLQVKLDCVKRGLQALVDGTHTVPDGLNWQEIEDEMIKGDDKEKRNETLQEMLERIAVALGYGLEDIPSIPSEMLEQSDAGSYADARMNCS